MPSLLADLISCCAAQVSNLTFGLLLYPVRGLSKAKKSMLQFEDRQRWAETAYLSRREILCYLSSRRVLTSGVGLNQRMFLGGTSFATCEVLLDLSTFLVFLSLISR